MFNISWLEIVLITGIGILIYGLVRWVHWGPAGADAVRTAQGHALWTGALAYLASGVTVNIVLGRINNLASGRYQPQIWEPERYPSQLSSDLSIVLLPILISLTIYLISQFTFPKPSGQVRGAVLTRRTVRDFLPHRLAYLGIAVWLVCVALVGGIAWLPGFSPVDISLDPSNFNQSPNSSSTFVHGRVDGWELATTLWIGLVVLALGVIGTLSVIARRRPLQGLTAVNNATLRTIAMNRLLRIGILISCGIATFAVQFAALRSGLADSPGWDSTSIWSLPTQFFAVLSLLLLLVVIAYQPPKLDPDNGQDPSEEIPDTPRTRQQRAETDAVESSNAARVLVVVSLTLSGMLMVFLATAAGSNFPPNLIAAFWLFLGSIAQIFLLFGDSSNWHLLRANVTPHQIERRPRLLSPLPLATLSISVLLFGFCCAYASLSTGDTLWIGLAAVAIFMLLVMALGIAAAFFRPRGDLVSVELDRTLRKVSVFRAIRLAAAALCASAAQLLTIAQSTFPGSGQRFSAGVAGLVLLALILAVFPGPNRKPTTAGTTGSTPNILKVGE